MNDQEAGRRRRLGSSGALAGLVGLLLLLGFGVSGFGAAQDATEEGVDDARATLEQWHETRRVIAEEKKNWRLGRELLKDRIEIARRELETVRESISEDEAEIEEKRKQKAELDAELERLVAGAERLETIIAPLEARTRELVLRLPEPAREKVDPYFQKIPEDAAAAKGSLSQRLSMVLAVLIEVNKFQGIVSTSPVQTILNDGRKAQVMAVYLGISQGYYVNGSGDAAGVGRPGPEGWVWEQRNEIAPQIAKAIKILDNELPAEFLRVPLKID